MTLSTRHRIRNSSPGGLRPSTLPLGHGGSPQYWLAGMWLIWDNALWFLVWPTGWPLNAWPLFPDQQLHFVVALRGGHSFIDHCREMFITTYLDLSVFIIHFIMGERLALFNHTHWLVFLRHEEPSNVCLHTYLWGIKPKFIECWATVADGDPALNKHWFYVFCWHGNPFKREHTSTLW